MAKLKTRRKPTGGRRAKRRAPGGAPSRRAWLPVAGLCGVALLAQLERFTWAGAIAAELSFQLALLSLLFAAGLALGRRWPQSAALACLGALLLLPMRGLFARQKLTPARGTPLRVTQLHLAGKSLDRARLSALIREHRPHILSMTGLDGPDVGRLARGFGSLRGRAGGGAGAGRALLWQRSLQTPAQAEAAKGPLRLRLGACTLDVVQVSLPSRLTREGWLKRDTSLAELSELSVARRSVWLGYFGSDVSAEDLSALRERRGLRDVRVGHGRLASVPAALGALGASPSHILVHGWISARRARTEAPLVDGAHRTVRAELELTERRCRPRAAMAKGAQEG